MEYYTYNNGQTQDCVARSRSGRDWAMVLLAYSATDVPPKQGFFIDQVFYRSHVFCLFRTMPVSYEDSVQSVQRHRTIEQQMPDAIFNAGLKYGII